MPARSNGPSEPAPPATAATAIPTATIIPHGYVARAVYASHSYWFAMFAASALGTNLGDLWVHALFHDRLTSLASLIVICGLAVWQDRRFAARTEAAYWVAIIGMRAAATNLADYLTHDLAFGYAAVTILLGTLALIAARFTTPDQRRGSAPAVDGPYWIAMFIGGLFGTTGGDLIAHTIGLYAASGVFCFVLAALIVARGGLAPASVLLYWCIVLAERCAGTAVGDSLASPHGLALGLPIASAFTAATLILALRARVILERQ